MPPTGLSLALPGVLQLPARDHRSSTWKSPSGNARPVTMAYTVTAADGRHSESQGELHASVRQSLPCRDTIVTCAATDASGNSTRSSSPCTSRSSPATSPTSNRPVSGVGREEPCSHGRDRGVARRRNQDPAACVTLTALQLGTRSTVQKGLTFRSGVVLHSRRDPDPVRHRMPASTSISSIRHRVDTAPIPTAFRDTAGVEQLTGPLTLFTRHSISPSTTTRRQMWDDPQQPSDTPR